jgi:hypothetical protein
MALWSAVWVVTQFAAQQSGMFALSMLGKLEEVLAAANLTVDDDDIESPTMFDDAHAAVRTFVGAGPTALAIRHTRERAVAQAVREALDPFTGMVCAANGVLPEATQTFTIVVRYEVALPMVIR